MRSTAPAGCAGTDASAWCRGRHRPDPRHAHRHGQAARPAAAGRRCCIPACGWPRSSTSRWRRRCCKAARAAGCPVSDGGGMAVGQAVGAFELFTGRPADAARMRAHFLQMVAPPTRWPDPWTDGATMTLDTLRTRSHRRRAQPAGAGRHRVHRIRHQPAAGPGPGAGDDGLPPRGAAPLARGAAVPPGRHERGHQRPCRRPACPPRTDRDRR
jgi:hypothetical protein